LKEQVFTIVLPSNVRFSAGNHFYYAAPAGITVAVPGGMKSFPTDLMPQ
jgi:hypothetical protein